MKKTIAALCISVMLVSLFGVTTYAASTTKYFSANLNSSYGDTWFADVMYNGEIVGFGNSFYTKKLLSGKKEVSTEYQNYELDRSLGSDLGVDIRVYAYVKVGSSIVDSEFYSWSDEGWNGGNSLGWIQADASTSGNHNVSEVGGYVRIINTSTYTSDTYNYKVTHNG